MELKEIKWLRYLATAGALATAAIVYVGAPIIGLKIIAGEARYMPYFYIWLLVIYTVGALGIYGIYLLTKLFKNLECGNILTQENANLLLRMDHILLLALGFSLTANVLLAFTIAHHPGFLLIWLAFMVALLILHLFCRPLYRIIERGAAIEQELELVI